MMKRQESLERRSHKMTKDLALKLLLPIVGLACVLSGIACKETPQGPPPPIGMDTTSHDFLWGVDTIGTFSSSLFDAWGSSSNNVYAVGIVYLPNRSLPTNVMHWDGNTWRPIDYVEGELRSIMGFGPNDIWVVGSWVVWPNPYTLVGHWNGSQWQTSIMQQHPGLFSVWGTSSSNLFACGYDGVILHYDGSSWTSMTSGTSHYLYGIWGVGNEVYAVGGTPSTGVGILVKYENGSWKTMYERLYRPDSLSGDQKAIWAEKDNRFFVHTYLGHDSTWQKLPVPNDNTYIENTFGNKENNLFMVGHFGLFIHYNGSSWKRYAQFYRKPGDDVLYGGWADAQNIFAVGSTRGARAIVFRGRR